MRGWLRKASFEIWSMAQDRKFLTRAPCWSFTDVDDEAYRIPVQGPWCSGGKLRWDCLYIKGQWCCGSGGSWVEPVTSSGGEVWWGELRKFPTRAPQPNVPSPIGVLRKNNSFCGSRHSPPERPSQVFHQSTRSSPILIKNGFF